ncbi:HNH endonuclease domain protein [Sulfitobacter noctilucicola]|uniref:HNH nuclease domain-containing protein n=1 Tax=Sulfitobacter noctilucicola TaxID=1342301 RepID=A0A7W6M7Q5_9RHOB|nr:HNH endonuclease [Sulfitobacter noctilucicola]KIN64889.1 HNH endonuclease domain protein [Sulfitobacter noctilucicola]MBB4173966.1 hypothetical protein [Sulfitobacter noctilucicola]
MDWTTLESRPGSFSKNFGWGAAPGLTLLHRVINAIFNGQMTPVPRDNARATISRVATGDPLIPLNFFLYNQEIDGENYIIPDQLVLEALANPHDQSFDRLAMSALNFSRVGTWRGARPWQAYPAPWARRFAVEEVWDGNSWNTRRITTERIETFMEGNMIYGGNTPHKFATNLHFLYDRSSLIGLTSSEREDWWASALFLFLDRCMMDGEIGMGISASDILQFVQDEDFWALTAANPTLAPFAALPIIEEYLDLGGPERLVSVHVETPTPKPSAFPTGRVDASKKASKPRKPADLTLTQVQRVYAQAQRQVRNRKHASWVKSAYENKCAICGIALVVDARGTTYSEAGHVQPIGDPFKGPDHLTNILPFCPNHHKAFDRGGVWIDPNGSTPIIRSVTIDKQFDGRKLEVLKEHNFDISFAEWHAKYFGHF